ncbi:hypothetical protein XU18_1775 [Perkinsela sp. CCAP 1560/4]|nr:hypothetical protein XU18_1775 [Perkinsela sp. CCAP 1560/4]|eukprot:KNH07554.1 hypothetical protein XU18_1775 [Perkinsela sp. CCAP 1560/4]
MRVELLLLDTVDPSLGRLDYAPLSQQALMEMFIEEVTNKQLIFEEWEGVTIEDGEVAEIDWYKFDIGGSLQLEWFFL